MSGAEALGVIASATQLTAYSIKIVVHLSELYTELRRAPCRTKDQISQVRELIETTTLIEQHRSLRSPAIIAQLQRTLDEAHSLYSALRDLANLYTKSPILRCWAITKGASVKEIQTKLEKLDRHTSTLKLCISLVHTDLLADIESGVRSISSGSTVRLTGQDSTVSSITATQEVAVGSSSRLVGTIENEVPPVNVMPEQRQEKGPQTSTSSQQTGFQFQDKVEFSGYHAGHFSNAGRDMINHYEQEKVNPFVHLSQEQRGPRGNTALHRSIQGNRRTCAELLIKRGAKVDAIGADNFTPLMLCAQYGDHDTARLLLEESAPTAGKNSAGNTALMIASSERQCFIVADLLSNGANVNATNDLGWTPLMFAADRGHEHVVSQLLSGDPKPKLEAKNRGGRTALMCAQRKGHTDVVNMLHGAGAENVRR
ncbi:Actin-related protein 3 [Lecanora helva]